MSSLFLLDGIAIVTTCIIVAFIIAYGLDTKEPYPLFVIEWFDIPLIRAVAYALWFFIVIHAISIPSPSLRVLAIAYGIMLLSLHSDFILFTSFSDTSQTQ